MIVNIAKSLFSSDDEQIGEVIAKLMRLAMEGRIYLDLESIPDIDKIRNSKWFKNHLSSFEQINIIDLIIEQSAYNNTERKFYFRTINVYLSNNEILPNNIHKILSEKSKVVLENTNDWCFIKGVVLKYKSNKKRKNIYKELLKHINNNWLEPLQTGGK